MKSRLRCQVYELGDVCWMIVCVLSDLTWLPLLGGGKKSWYIIIIIILFNLQCKFLYAGMIYILTCMASIRAGTLCILPAGKICMPLGTISIPIGVYAHWCNVYTGNSRLRGSARLK